MCHYLVTTYTTALMDDLSELLQGGVDERNLVFGGPCFHLPSNIKVFRKTRFKEGAGLGVKMELFWRAWSKPEMETQGCNNAYACWCRLTHGVHGCMHAWMHRKTCVSFSGSKISSRHLPINWRRDILTAAQVQTRSSSGPTTGFAEWHSCHQTNQGYVGLATTNQG